MKKTFIAIITATLCLGGLASLQWYRMQSQLTAANLDSQTLTEEEQRLIQEQEELHRNRLQFWQTMPVFGFENLVADWTFLNFLNYFGDNQARQTTGYTATPDFFGVIVQRDPYFRLSYRFLSSAVTLFAAQPTETVSLLDQGLSYMTPTFPEDSFWLWRYKAVDQLLFLNDTAAAIQSYETSAEWAAASPIPDAERYVTSAQRTAEFLRQDPESRQVKANSWIMVWANAINESVRQHAQEQIEALGYEVIREGASIRLEDRNASSEPEAAPSPTQESEATPAPEATNPSGEGDPSPSTSEGTDTLPVEDDEPAQLEEDTSTP